MQQVKAIAAGATHACALTAAGRVRCWGSNTFGALGDGSTQSSFDPVYTSRMFIDGTPNPRIMPTNADMGITLFNRMVDIIVREEGQPA